MASPLTHQGGTHPPPATEPSTSVAMHVKGPGAISRPPSEPHSRSSSADRRPSQPHMQSIPMTQSLSASSRGPTPVNGTQHQKANGEIKSVTGTEEYVQLSDLIKSAKPETVRQVIRDHWQRCLIGSDFHVGFILNTTLHHASPHLLCQAVQDFGAKLASSTKHKWVQHLDTNDVDEIADALFQRASDRFLDRALARRFETISGRALVNALARAERLGYDTRDIVEEKDANKSEHVIPSMHPSMAGAYPPNGTQQRAPPSYTPQYAQQHQQPPQNQYHPRPPPPPPQPSFPVTQPTDAQVAEVYPLGIVFCDACGRPCSGSVAVENHLRKGACSNHVTKLERLGHDTCLHCGVTFSSNGGLLYHVKSDVCGVYTTSVREKMIELLTERAKIPSVKPVNPSYQAPTLHAMPATPYRSSPARTDPADAYAALTPQQQSQFDAEMKHAEEMYGAQMRDAMALSPEETEVELNKIKNRLNSRQSTLRKKYGIKLRDRRTRAQIDADNARIAAKSPVPPSSSQGTKRPLSTHADSPRKRVPLSEMSGLTGAAASAETTDPTLDQAPMQPRAPTQAAQTGAQIQEASRVPTQVRGTQKDAMAVDSDQSAANTESDRPSPSDGQKPVADVSRPLSTGGA